MQHIVRRFMAGFALLLGLIVLAGSSSYAQDKTACELLSKADAEAVVGVTLQPPKPGAPFRSLLGEDFTVGKVSEGCEFTNFAFNQPKPPKVVGFFLEVRYSALPDARAVVEARKQVAARTYGKPTDLPDLGDAAFWIGPPNSESLFVFRGGTMRLVIGPSEIGLEQEKTLARRVLDGLGKTGYAYLGTPKGDAASAVASAGGTASPPVTPTKPAGSATSAAADKTAHPPVPGATGTTPAKAAPTPTAANGLVRKSKAYWDAFQTDLIRQIFDGGFGSDADASTQFREMFGHYLGWFSMNCRAYLPAKHEVVTMTLVTRRRDNFGNLVTEQSRSSTVDLDSRFAAKFREYEESLNSSAQGLSIAIGVLSGRDSLSAHLDPVLDVKRFFETETCQSAAMRQLGENLLRAAHGGPSLQQAGTTIAGAPAESDKSLPPDRFARFVDGCMAYVRSRPGFSDRESHWCECLNDQYRNVMSREEEVRYANDFRRLFYGEIAQPMSTDPAWRRLHPAVDRCVQ